ncbi:MAG: hypothetical protein FD123_375 [Bacteroidetes bacterium]|nr:MAG: hypothetical protein FD123_375 [Bacteroidota bacterium]
MARLPSDKVFSLVKSLRAGEKKAFRQQAKQNGAADQLLYLRLFDVLDAMEAYDEAAVLKKIPALPARQLSNQKNYLFQQLTDSLSTTRTVNEITRQFTRAMLRADVLFTKKMYAAALDELDAALLTAKRHCRHTMVLELLTTKRMIIIKMRRPDMAERMSQGLEEFSMHSKYLDEMHRMRLLHQEISKFTLAYSSLRDKATLDAFEAIFVSAGFDFSYASSDYMNQNMHYSVRCIYHRYRREWQPFYEQAKAGMMHAESDPILFTCYRDKHLLSTHQFLIALAKAGSMDDIEMVRDRIHSYLDMPEKIMGRENRIIAVNTSTIFIIVLNKRGLFEEAVAFVKKIAPHFNDCIGSMHTISVANYYNLATLAFFGSGDYKAALKFVLKGLALSDRQMLREHRIYLRFFQLLIHFELDTILLLDNLVKSVYKFLLQLGPGFRFESLIIDFIRMKLPKINSRTELLRAFSELKKQVEALALDPMEGVSLDYFDWPAWLESKITGKSFSALAKRNFAKSQAAES